MVIEDRDDFVENQVDLSPHFCRGCGSRGAGRALEEHLPAGDPTSGNCDHPNSDPDEYTN